MSRSYRRTPETIEEVQRPHRSIRIEALERHTLLTGLPFNDALAEALEAFIAGDRQ